MRKPFIFLIILIPILIVSCIIFVAHTGTFPLLNPSGSIAMQERNLMVGAVLLMLCLALPVIAIMFFVAWRYRASNTKARYAPEWTGNTFLKLLWWALPFTFVCIFACIIWYAAHALDPYKPLKSAYSPMTIQVVALRWKWLFLYPKEHIATVNFLEFPVHTPVNFMLTADAPMNSFWIPSLSGQIYAMASMETRLHILSDKTGDFPGGAAEINGSGLAGMRFTARVVRQEDFDAWVEKVKKSTNPLTLTGYNTLVKPSEDTPTTLYSSVADDLYSTIIMKYMEPSSPKEQ